jgi:hypothetical protein
MALAGGLTSLGLSVAYFVDRALWREAKHLANMKAVEVS